MIPIGSVRPRLLELKDPVRTLDDIIVIERAV